jgi:hypothetical protein
MLSGQYYQLKGHNNRTCLLGSCKFGSISNIDSFHICRINYPISIQSVEFASMFLSQYVERKFSYKRITVFRYLYQLLFPTYLTLIVEITAQHATSTLGFTVHRQFRDSISSQAQLRHQIKKTCRSYSSTLTTIMGLIQHSKLNSTKAFEGSYICPEYRHTPWHSAFPKRPVFPPLYCKPGSKKKEPDTFIGGLAYYMSYKFMSLFDKAPLWLSDNKPAAASSGRG